MTGEKCSALLIGVVLTDVLVQHNRAIPRKLIGKSAKNPCNTGIVKDISSMMEFMNDRNIYIYDVMCGQHVKQNKSDILRTFKGFFSQKGRRQFVIYYSGYGSNGMCSSNRGDCCFKTNGEGEARIAYIELKDILELWDEMRIQCGADSYDPKDRYLLFIVADSCYSGSWVEEIKAKRPYMTAALGEKYCEKYRDVHMIASCNADEICCYTVAKGGDFTNWYINADSSRHNLKDTAAHVAKVAAQGVIQAAFFPIYMPVKGLTNFYKATCHEHTPIATNEIDRYRKLLMKYDAEVLPIGKGLGIASGWSWMLRGQICRT